MRNFAVTTLIPAGDNGIFSGVPPTESSLPAYLGVLKWPGHARPPYRVTEPPSCGFFLDTAPLGLDTSVLARKFFAEEGRAGTHYV